jgi:hypothetical protein
MNLKMTEKVRSIPRPLVQTNQVVIVISVLLTWLTRSEIFLLIPLLSGLSGLIFNFNPIMQLTRLFLKKPMGSYIPEDWAQQQFNQKIAVFCLGAGFISFWLGWNLAGYVFTILVATAATIALLDFVSAVFFTINGINIDIERALDKQALFL